MTGMVLGSVGTPLSPSHAAQSCAFASTSSAACASGMASARPIPIFRMAEKQRADISPPGCPGMIGEFEPHQESPMRARLMLTLAATAAAMAFLPPAIDDVRAQGDTALTGIVASEAEGRMEGVVVTAQKAGSIVRVSVTTDAQGRYSFPQNRLDPGRYTLGIRAVAH